VVLPKGSLTFTSAYAGITKEFSLSELAKVVTSLPASVWVDGKSIGLEQIGVATEPDHQTMDQVTEKVRTYLAGLGYRVHRLSQ
jgi:hypothetical protein